MKQIKQCPACDGDGSLMVQWAKKACDDVGGTKHKTDRGEVYYRDQYGREMVMKTIGGVCTICEGTGNIEVKE